MFDVVERILRVLTFSIKGRPVLLFPADTITVVQANAFGKERAA